MQIKKINSILDLLHDAIFISIKDDIQAKSSKLNFLSEDEKSSITITLHGVVSSRCINWKFGNIVLDALVIDKECIVNKKEIIDLIIYAEELSEIQIQNQAYMLILKDIEVGKLVIFELNPSYGAYYVGIAHNITIKTTKI